MPNITGPFYRKVILETVVGSTVHGTSVEDGLEDLDLMSIVIEEPWHVMGFPRLEFEPRDNWLERTKPMGVRSEAGDVDHVFYGLRKYLGLALKSNPTVLLPLFAGPEATRQISLEGHQLRALLPHLLSRKAGSAFLGYLKDQVERLVGTRGQMNVTRPELIAKYGFDTKYAGHIVRLGIQGIELLRDGTITLPMLAPDRALVLEVRTGRFTYDQVLSLVENIQAELQAEIAKSRLPEMPNFDVVESWMIRTYLQHWATLC